MGETLRTNGQGGDEAGRTSGRALVTTGPAQARGGDERPLTDFLTQLIACNRRVPAYRQARKAEPTSAALAYSGAGRTFSARLDRSV